MGDFLPGYVTTFCNTDFNKLKKKIIILGKENGKIYSGFDSKEDLFKKVLNRKDSATMVCYYCDIDFEQHEREILWSYRIILFNEVDKKRVIDSVKSILVRR